MNTREVEATIQKSICWATLPLPFAYGKYHFVAVGDGRSGKTTIIQMLLRSVLRRVHKGSRKRAMLFDAKVDLYPFLVALGLKEYVRVLNPFDARCYAWNMAKDIEDYATAHQIAAILIPQKGDHNPFFPRAAQSVLAAIMDGLNHSALKGKWTLRHVILALRSMEDMKVIIERSPDGGHAYRTFLDGKRDSAGDVVATIHTYCDRLIDVAKAWQRRPQVALSEWIEQEAILLLGASAKYRDILADLNAAMFHRAAQLLSDLPEMATEAVKPGGIRPQTWVVIDELTYAGHLPMLMDILATTASKGGCFVLGFQHIGPLRTLYGDATGSIVRHCKNYAFLRTTDRETQDFLASSIGSYEADIAERGYSISRSETVDTRMRNLKGHLDAGPSSVSTSKGESVNIRRQKRERLLAEQFAEDLPMPSEKLRQGISCYVRVPELDPTFVTIPSEVIDGTRVAPADGVNAFEPMPNKELEPWTPEERAILGLGNAASPEKLSAAGTTSTTAAPIGLLKHLRRRERE